MICSPFLSQYNVVTEWADNKSNFFRVRPKADNNCMFGGTDFLYNFVRHKRNMFLLLNLYLVFRQSSRAIWFNTAPLSIRMLACIPLMVPLVIIKLDCGNANGSAVFVQSSWLNVSESVDSIGSFGSLDTNCSGVSGGSDGLGITGSKFVSVVSLSSRALYGSVTLFAASEASSFFRHWSRSSGVSFLI